MLIPNRKLRHTSLVILTGVLILFLVVSVISVIGNISTNAKPFGDVPVQDIERPVVILQIEDTQNLEQVELHLAEIIIPANDRKICFDWFRIENVLLNNPRISTEPEIEDLLSSNINAPEIQRSGRPIHMLQGSTFREVCSMEFIRRFDSNELQSRLFSEFEALPNMISATIKIATENELFYPFDHRYMDVELTFMTADNEIVAPQVVGLTVFPNWDEKVKTGYLNTPDSIYGGDSTFLRIKLYHPLSQRILTVLIFVVLSTFIVSLFYIEERGSFLEVSVAIVLGLWGVQDIIVPEGTTGPFMIEQIVLALYVLLAIVVLLRLVMWPLLIQTSETRIAKNPGNEKQRANRIMGMDKLKPRSLRKRR